MNAFTFQIILWIDITEYDKMKREFIHITDNNKHRLMSDSGFWHGSTNKNSRDKMKKILSMAVLNELTERQRICIVDYYLNGKKEKEIAKELGVPVLGKMPIDTAIAEAVEAEKFYEVTNPYLKEIDL